MLRSRRRRIRRSRALVSPELLAAMGEARERLIAWHRAGMAAPFEIDTAPRACAAVASCAAIRRVGLYVPAGSAPLPSTALMLGVPARWPAATKWCCARRRAQDGSADPAVLVAAQPVRHHARVQARRRAGDRGDGVRHRVRAALRQAVRAGQQLTSPRPSSRSRCCRAAPAIDMPAGPSEVLVIADAGAHRRCIVASDLLSQAEHGPDSQVILVTDSTALHRRGASEQIETQLAALPRAAIATPRARARAPDPGGDAGHGLRDQQRLRARAPDPGPARAARPGWTRCAAPARCSSATTRRKSLGDYCSGTNHVLPTNGAARAYSGVSVASFQTSISVQSVSREGLAAIGPCAVTLARAEGLEAHAQAVLLPAGGRRHERRARPGARGPARLRRLRVGAARDRHWQASGSTPTNRRGHRRPMPARVAQSLSRSAADAAARAHGAAVRRARRTTDGRPRQRRRHRPAGARVLPRRASTPC